MKLKLILLLFISVTLSISAQAQDNASSILENAIVKAKAENKNIFVKYSASWCGWCKKMDKQMKSESCKSFFDDNFVIITLVVKEFGKNKHLENPGGNELLKKHNGDKSGLPFWVILDNNGDLIEDSYNGKGENLGCPATKEEVKDFIAILEKTSDLTEKDLSIISNIFLSK